MNDSSGFNKIGGIIEDFVQLITKVKTLLLTMF